MSSSPKGYPTQKKDDLVVGAQFSTVEPLEADKYGLNVHASMYVRLVTSDIVEANSTATQINATGHSAVVGDIIRITSGALNEERVRVIKIETDIIHVTALSAAPAAAVTFEILRHVNPRADNDGDIQVNVTSTATPTIFIRNGVDTEVEESTGTPANSRPLPTKILDGSGVEVDFATEAKQDAQTALLTTIDADTNDIATNSSAINNKLPVTLGQKTMANSLAVVIASDQSTVGVELDAPLPAGTNNIGDVGVLSLPALPAGTNTIGNVNVNNLDIVDFIDTTPVLDASVTTINGSAGAFVTLVASLAATVRRVQVLDTTGAFLGLYTGPAASEVLKVIIGPGSDQIIDCAIPSGTRVSVRRLDSTDNVTTGNLAINFLG